MSVGRGSGVFYKALTITLEIAIPCCSQFGFTTVRNVLYQVVRKFLIKLYQTLSSNSMPCFSNVLGLCVMRLMKAICVMKSVCPVIQLLVLRMLDFHWYSPGNHESIFLYLNYKQIAFIHNWQIIEQDK